VGLRDSSDLSHYIFISFMHFISAIDISTDTFISTSTDISVDMRTYADERRMVT